MTTQYTGKEALHIRTSFAYMISLFMIMLIGIGFQIYSGMTFAEYFPTLVLSIITIGIAFVIYRKKKNKKDGTGLMWLVSFLTVTAPLFGKV